MTKKQMQNLAGILAILGIYFVFFRKPKGVTTDIPVPPVVPTPTQIILEKRGIFTVVTKTDPLNIRKSPDRNSSIVGKLPKDDLFEGARVKNMPWVAVYDIKNKANVKGYVSADYVVAGMK